MLNFENHSKGSVPMQFWKNLKVMEGGEKKA